MRESLKFKILSLFKQCTQEGKFHTSPPKEKSLQNWTGIRDHHTYLLCSQQHTRKRFPLIQKTGNYYHSPQHELLNTAITLWFLNTKDSLATQLQRCWETQEFHTSTDFWRNGMWISLHAALKHVYINSWKQQITCFGESYKHSGNP